MKAEITKEFVFEAAHHLPPVGPDHKCHRIHGHLFRIEITVAGEVDPAFGWIRDFGDLAAIGAELVSLLDHRVLNEIPGLDVPTSENLARWIFYRFSARVPETVAVTVHESPTSRCTWRPLPSVAPVTETVTCCGEDLGFSAAHFLLHPPGGREPIHGHDYRVRLVTSCQPGGLVAIRDLLSDAGRRVASELDHRLLLPGRPCAGRLEAREGEIVLALPAETLRFPRADCVVIDVPNTTTECLASLVASRVADRLRSSGVGPVEATVTESTASSATARSE